MRREEPIADPFLKRLAASAFLGKELIQLRGAPFRLIHGSEKRSKSFSGRAFAGDGRKADDSVVVDERRQPVIGLLWPLVAEDPTNGGLQWRVGRSDVAVKQPLRCVR